ncbi:hypothetical protein P691DRAFT_733474 [Macrolepiota fuliginosa MF-IS2]|uniref:MYND-type domain-containing protein n=1 Tax=Macrolepiota fuliginosa MF-IS2 TaxID=1400762 RepID=A0A9P5X929_9AGAR|nr:hypothetical protein P691DRAFT_733474 [Macrolepiota fuliginosa MF-IS2]
MYVDPLPTPYPHEEEDWQQSYQSMMQGCRAVPGTNPAKLREALEKMYNGDVDFDECVGPTGNSKVISVPLQKLDKCGVCAKTTALRLCSSCASAIYCSKECQRADWREHKLFCAQTQQVNLKVFYPFIAYLFDYLRHRGPKSGEDLPKNLDPFILSKFEQLGLGTRPHKSDFYLHPVFRHKILRAPAPGARKATPSENTLHHNVVLGEKHNVGLSRIPDPAKLSIWWRGKPPLVSIKLYLHALRETFILEITVTISLLLLSEVYSTHLSRGTSEGGPKTWKHRPCFRLEYGHSPVSDFGICKGRIRGKTNRVQTWTYYEPKTNTRTTVLDPDNHYWLYFRTIKGEEIILDCCSYSYGMETCVDASGCIKCLPSMFRHHGSARTPANFRTAQDADRQLYTLVEEKRFSVMHNTKLHKALSWEVFGGRREDQHAIVREFMTELQGKPVTLEQEDCVREFRTMGAMMLSQVLLGRHWKDWERPTVHSRDDCFDEGGSKRKEYMKGSPEDETCQTSFSGMLGLFSEALGIN